MRSPKTPRPRSRDATATVAVAVAVAAGLNGLGGCGGGGAGGVEGAFLDDLPRIHLEETARIGSTEDPDYGFSRIGQVQVGPDGNIWVAETQDREIRVYTPEGELMRRVGRRGEGPGEFSHTLSRFGFVGDTVWVWEDLPRRLGLFTREGRVLGTVRVDLVEADLFGPSERARLGPGFVDPEGFLIGVRGGEVAAQGPPQRDTASIPLVRFTLDGRVVDTVGRYEVARRDYPGPISVGRSRHALPVPPSPEPRWVVSGRELVRVDHEAGDGTGQVRITRMTHAGDTVRSRAYALRSIPFPDAYLNSIATDRAQQVGPIMMFGLPGGGVETLERHPQDSAAARVAIRRQMPFPALQPPIQAHHQGADGALWLRREETGATEHRWIVFDTEDRAVGVVEVPRGTRIAWSRGSDVWGVDHDEFGVPWLVRFRRVPEG
jgi:hypothetical protein